MILLNLTRPLSCLLQMSWTFDKPFLPDFLAWIYAFWPHVTVEIDHEDNLTFKT